MITERVLGCACQASGKVIKEGRGTHSQQAGMPGGRNRNDTSSIINRREGGPGSGQYMEQGRAQGLLVPSLSIRVEACPAHATAGDGAWQHRHSSLWGRCAFLPPLSTCCFGASRPGWLGPCDSSKEASLSLLGASISPWLTVRRWVLRISPVASRGSPDALSKKSSRSSPALVKAGAGWFAVGWSSPMNLRPRAVEERRVGPLLLLFGLTFRMPAPVVIAVREWSRGSVAAFQTPV